MGTTPAYCGPHKWLYRFVISIPTCDTERPSNKIASFYLWLQNFDIHFDPDARDPKYLQCGSLFKTWDSVGACPARQGLVMHELSFRRRSFHSDAACPTCPARAHTRDCPELCGYHVFGGYLGTGIKFFFLFWYRPVPGKQYYLVSRQVMHQ